MPIVSKTEMLKKLNYIMSLSNLSEENKKIFIEKYFSFESDQIINMARRFITKARLDVSKLLQVLISANLSPNNFISPIPLLCLSPDITKIRVYPNIIIENLNYSHPKNDIFNNTNTPELHTFILKYKQAKNSLHLQKLWASLPIAWKRIKYYEDLPTSQVLAKYLYKDVFSIGKNTDRGLAIRKLANIIDEIRKPLEIVFAETPEDFFDMYETGPTSCMTWKGIGERLSKWHLMLKKRICPTSFFSYFPITKGAYAKKNNEVICRTIIYTFDGKFSYYGRIFSTSEEVTTQFIKALKEKGIIALTSSIDSSIYPEFSIPGIKMENSNAFICPFPYFDNISFRTRVIFKDKTFFFGKEGAVPCQRTGGYLLSSDYVLNTCSYCHNTILQKDEIVAEDDPTKIYCSWGCAEKEEYVKVINGRGISHCKKLDGSEIKANFINKYYTTIVAARDCGYFIALNTLFLFPEENNCVNSAKHCWDTIAAQDNRRYLITEDFFKRYLKTDKSIWDSVSGIWDSVSCRNKIPVASIKTQKNLIFDSNESLFSKAKLTTDNFEIPF